MQVVFAPDWDGDANPYLRNVAAGLRTAGAQVTALSDADRLPGPPDVVLLHWVEGAWVRGRRPAAQLRQRRVRQALLERLRDFRAQGVPVVWTVHDLTPHQWSGSTEAWLRRIQPFHALLDAVVHLTEASRQHPAFRGLADLPSVVVPHPTYEPRVTTVATVGTGRIDRLLLLGGLNPRKGAAGALRTIVAANKVDAVITGNVTRWRSGSHRSLRIARRHHDRITVRPGWLTDTQVDALFDGRTAALLHQPGALNSGVMLLALSRASVVLAPNTPTNRELQAEIGAGWLRLFTPPIDHAQLDALLDHPVPRSAPPLDRRHPEQVGQAFRRGLEKLVAAVEERR